MADTWTTKAAMPGGARSLGRQAASVNGDGFAAGGNSGGALDRHEMYTPGSNSWATKTALPDIWNGAAAAPIGTDKYYLTGGDLGGNSMHVVDNIHREYSKSGNSWVTKTAPGYSDTAASYCGIGCLAGPLETGKLNFFDAADGFGSSRVNKQYNQSGDSWATKTTPQDMGGYPTGASLDSDKFHAFGGTIYNTSGGYLYNKQYSSAGDGWTSKTDMYVTHGGGAVSVVNSKAYVAFGDGSNTVSFEPTEGRNNTEYDINTDAWTSKTTTPNDRKHLGAFAVSYDVYFVGGYSYDTNLAYAAADPPALEALEDLKAFADAQYPFALEDVKTHLAAFKNALEDLKTDIQATSLSALEDLKAEIKANADAFTDVKVSLVANADTFTDLRTEIATSDQAHTDLRCELKVQDRTGPYIVSAGLTPQPNQAGVAVNVNLVIKLRDDGWGIDISSVWIDVTDATTTRYKSGDAGFSYTLSSDKREAVITIDPTTDLEHNRSISVKVFAADLAGNPGLTVQ